MTAPRERLKHQLLDDGQVISAYIDLNVVGQRHEQFIDVAVKFLYIVDVDDVGTVDADKPPGVEFAFELANAVGA